jgi:hypothetical protein
MVQTRAIDTAREIAAEWDGANEVTMLSIASAPAVMEQPKSICRSPGRTVSPSFTAVGDRRSNLPDGSARGKTSEQDMKDGFDRQKSQTQQKQNMILSGSESVWRSPFKSIRERNAP